MFANNFVYQGVKDWDAFEPVLTKAEEMDADTIWRCAVDMPEEGTKEIEMDCIG